MLFEDQEVWVNMIPNVEFIGILRKMFEENPGKLTIELKEKCSDCGDKVVLPITRTSGGYGINGGALLKGKGERFLVTCADCYSSVILEKASPVTGSRTLNRLFFLP